VYIPLVGLEDASLAEPGGMSETHRGLLNEYTFQLEYPESYISSNIIFGLLGEISKAHFGFGIKYFKFQISKR
jgi:hypothetical protein